MALGTRKRSTQALLISTTELPAAPKLPFYDQLKDLLDSIDFDHHVELACRPYYKSATWHAARTTSQPGTAVDSAQRVLPSLAPQLLDWRRLRARPGLVCSRQPKRPTVSRVRAPRADPGRLYALAHAPPDSTQHPTRGPRMGPATPPRTGIGRTPCTSLGLGELADCSRTSPAICAGLSEVRRELGRKRLS